MIHARLLSASIAIACLIYTSLADASGIFVVSSVFAEGGAFANGFPIGGITVGSRDFDCFGTCVRNVPVGTRFANGGDFFSGQAFAEVDVSTFTTALSIAAAADVTPSISQPFNEDQGYTGNIRSQLFTDLAPGTAVTLHVTTSFEYSTGGNGGVSANLQNFHDAGTHDLTYTAFVGGGLPYIAPDGMAYHPLDMMIASGSAGVDARYGTEQHASFTGGLAVSAFTADGTPLPFIQAVPEPQTYALILAGLALLGFSTHRKSLRIA
jgi:hypothetical protein